MSSYCRDREQPAVLAHDQAQQQVFRLLAPSSPGQVGYSRLCTNLNEVMQVFAALSPLADHVALEIAKGLEPCHQPANLSWVSTIVQTVQPLERATILSRQFSCSTVNLLLRPTSRVTGDSGGKNFQLAQAVTRPLGCLKSQFEVGAKPIALAAISQLAPPPPLVGLG